MDTVFTRTEGFHSEFVKPFITLDNSLNQAILKVLYSGVSYCFERHSKYRFAERCVCLFQSNILINTNSPRSSPYILFRGDL